MSIDLNKYDEAEEMEYELVEEGKYNMTISELEKGESKTGKPNAKITLTIDGSSQKLPHYVLIEHIESVLELFNVENIDNLVGAKATDVKVKHKDYNGKTYANPVFPRKLIPTDAIVKVKLDIKRQDGDFVTTNPKTGSKYVNCVLTAYTKEYEGQEIYFMLGVHSNKGDKYRNMGIAQAKSIINSAYGLKNDDVSPKAMETRILKDDYSNLDGLVFYIMPSIEKSADYPDKNGLHKIITPSNKDGLWSKIPSTTKTDIDDNVFDEPPF